MLHACGGWDSSTTQSKTRPHPTRSEITRQHNISSFIYTNAYGGLLKLMYVYINNSYNDQYQSHFIFMHEFWTILTSFKYHTYMKFEKIHISQPFPSQDRPIPPISVPSMHQTHFFYSQHRLAQTVENNPFITLWIPSTIKTFCGVRVKGHHTVALWIGLA